MAAIFQTGFLAICLIIVVSAQFEYNDKVVNSLPYQTLVEQNAPKLVPEILNLKKKANIVMVDTPSGKGRSFVVQPKKTLSKPENSDVPDPCNGLPGLTVNLQKKNFILFVVLNYFFPRPSGLCYAGLTVDIRPNSNNKYLRLSAKFRDSLSKNSVEIVVDTFKDPIDKVSIDSVRLNKVPKIDSPIPFESFREDNENPGKYTVRAFLGGISWLKDLLDRAVFKDGEKDVETGEYTEYYYAPPAILETELFDMIVGLGNYMFHHDV